MRWFLQVLGLEVTVLGKVGHDVILATPLPALKPLPPPASKAGMVVNDALGMQLADADGIFWRVFTGAEWRCPDRRWKS